MGRGIFATGLTGCVWFGRREVDGGRGNNQQPTANSQRPTSKAGNAALGKLVERPGTVLFSNMRREFPATSHAFPVKTRESPRRT